MRPAALAGVSGGLASALLQVICDTTFFDPGVELHCPSAFELELRAFIDLYSLNSLNFSWVR